MTIIDARARRRFPGRALFLLALAPALAADVAAQKPVHRQGPLGADPAVGLGAVFDGRQQLQRRRRERRPRNHQIQPRET